MNAKKIFGILLIALGAYLVYFYATNQKYTCKKIYRNYCAGNAKPTCLYVGIPSLLLGAYLIRKKEWNQLSKDTLQDKPKKDTTVINQLAVIEPMPELKPKPKSKPKQKSIQSI